MKKGVITLKDLNKSEKIQQWHLIYDEEDPEWKKLDAPYFPLKQVNIDEFVTKHNSSNRLGIFLDGHLIGDVCYYWEHEESHWLEVGLCIYEPKYWGKGYGEQALVLWINHLFDRMDLVRIGLTTWSANIGMMKLAEKLGMQQEACLRKCRLWQGKYYDSIRYGILKEEWQEEMVK